MMKDAIWVLRDYNLPVITAYHAAEEWYPAPGTPNFEYPETLKLIDDDPKIVNTYPSSFTKTK